MDTINSGISSPVAERATSRTIKRHNLKIDLSHYCDICSGAKTAEVRIHDRDYKVGDKLFLTPWHPSTGYTDDPFICVVITHILKSTEFSGLVDGYSLLSFKLFHQVGLSR